MFGAVSQANQVEHCPRSIPRLALLGSRRWEQADHTAQDSAAEVDMAGDQHIVERSQIAEQADILKRPGDAALDDAVRRPAGDVLSIVAQFAARRGGKPGDHVEQRCFASAIGADQAENLIFVDHERHIIDGNQAAEMSGQALHFQERSALRSTLLFLILIGHKITEIMVSE